MRSRIFKVVMVVAIAVAATGWTLARPAAAPPPEVGPALVSIGVMTFGPTGCCLRPIRRRRRSTRSTSARRPTAARPARPTSRRSIRRSRRCSARRWRRSRVSDLVIHPKTQERLHLAVMRGTGADAKPALLRVDGDGKIAADRDRQAEVHEGGAVERAGAAEGAPQPARRLGHRHGVRQRQADRRRALERGVRVEAALVRVSVRRRRTRAPASRSSTATTARSRRARRSTPSSPTRSTASRT